MARLNRGRLVPHRLSPDDRRAAGVADELCELYAAHVGEPRATLERELAAREEELGPGLDARRGFRIVRALAKLLEERAGWVSPTDADPYTLRTRVFELAAALPEPPAAEPGLLEVPTREDVLSRVSAETGVADVAALMYADRQGAQLLGEFDRPSPEELVRRYNVAQVQGVLYAAKDLVVDLGEGADARLVFHYVKLLGLIHEIEPLERSGYRLRLDGPLSIFGGTRKYGLRLAKFLPGLLLTSPWRLSANVDWKGRDAILELDSETGGLESHYLGPRDERDADEVRGAFARAWERAKDTEGWELLRAGGVLSFPERKAALVPDFTLRRAETGEVAHLEILGFWSERNLVERVALLREAGERGHRVLVAASERLGASPDVLSEAVEAGVIPFKDRLAAKAVLAALGERDGRGEAGPAKRGPGARRAARPI
jgi:predicted nuclease of restriction endonuclease-like RecB superfamily